MSADPIRPTADQVEEAWAGFPRALVEAIASVWMSVKNRPGSRGGSFTFVVHFDSNPAIRHFTHEITRSEEVPRQERRRADDP